ncbi:hypothetical protein L209DRAFT_215358 [Thermothelomyces heterothallicus CBS 203.75]
MLRKWDVRASPRTEWRWVLWRRLAGRCSVERRPAQLADWGVSSGYLDRKYNVLCSTSSGFSRQCPGVAPGQEQRGRRTAQMLPPPTARRDSFLNCYYLAHRCSPLLPLRYRPNLALYGTRKAPQIPTWSRECELSWERLVVTLTSRFSLDAESIPWRVVGKSLQSRRVCRNFV